MQLLVALKEWGLLVVIDDAVPDDAVPEAVDPDDVNSKDAEPEDAERDDAEPDDAEPDENEPSVTDGVEGDPDAEIAVTLVESDRDPCPDEIDDPLLVIEDRTLKEPVGCADVTEAASIADADKAEAVEKSVGAAVEFATGARLESEGVRVRVGVSGVRVEVHADDGIVGGDVKRGELLPWSVAVDWEDVLGLKWVAEALLSGE
ncbi:hypothetical protein PRZ48_008007 [Zasmidium cellare]|uniref:Uncharacterized protein n=1 Tax=Zasmidium cellare TaxID=395010 RepID=A0ABR0EF05_ZASCE|nr:hypothetical protein PRZ48_008007 [Zasmidium cellare]